MSERPTYWPANPFCTCGLSPVEAPDFSCPVHIKGDAMTDRDILHAQLLCSAIKETCAKVARDLAEMKRAAEEFAASIEKLKEPVS